MAETSPPCPTAPPAVPTSSPPNSGSQSEGKLQKGLDFFWTKVFPFLLTLQTQVKKVIVLLQPYYEKGRVHFEKLLDLLRPYGLEEITKAFVGFAMMFFGGFFITTVAVVEAIRQGGSADFLKALKILQGQMQVLHEANEKDNKEDLDNDGIADVQQISKAELSRRKFALFFKSCDPDTVSVALSNLYKIFVAVVATLRLRFARTVSLGAAIGESLEKPILKYVAPRVKPFVEEEYQKWIIPMTRHMCRFVGVSFAFYLQRVLATLHTAIRGARLFVDGVTELSQRNGYSYLTEGYADEALAAFLSLLGVYSQFFVFPYMPFFVRLLFFPATFIEWCLSTFVSLSV